MILVNRIFIIIIIFYYNICKENNNNKNKINFNKKNLIIGSIQNYSLQRVLPFFKSLMYVHFDNCEIVMFIRNISSTLLYYLKSIGVIVYAIPEKYKKIPIINLRWKLYFDFLKTKKDKYKLVFHADVRDTFFQKNVFKYYENFTSFLGIAIEDGILNETRNKKKIIDYIGEEKQKMIQKERIICFGSMWGVSDKFFEFSKILWEKLFAKPLAIDQGVGNYLFYYEKLFKDYIIISDNYGPVMTIGLTKREYIKLDEKNNILNFKGEIAHVVHQYDRKVDIMIKIIAKFCPELYGSIKPIISYLNSTEKNIFNKTFQENLIIVKTFYTHNVFFQENPIL